MLGMVAQRLGWAVFTMVIIALAVFLGLEAMPGDACTVHLGRGASDAALATCRARLNLSDPALYRFFTWAQHLLTEFDLGNSVQRGKPITEIVSWRLRNTIILAGTAKALGVPLAIVLGVLTGIYRDSVLDVSVSAFSMFLMTIPEFISGTLLIFIFAIGLGWTSGIVTLSYKAPFWDMMVVSFLPAVTLSFILVAHIARMTRASMIEAMQSDFVLMARLKNVPRRQIIWRHALPNALLPTISVIGLTVAWLLGGVVIVESVFNYPGLGRLAVNAVSDQDLPLVQAIALLFGAIYTLVNLSADLLSITLNPKLRGQRQ